MRLWTYSVAVVILWSAAWAENAPDILILTNINVVDTRFGSVQTNHTVVIKEGRIVAVARHGLIEESHHTQIINASGKYLIPGLWDMHVHSAAGTGAAWDERIIYPMYVANGVTGIRDMGGDLNLLKQRRSHIWVGELIGPHIVMAGPFLDGGKSNAQTVGVNNPEEGRAAVRDLKKNGADFVKILSGLSRDSYFAIADEARKQHLPLAGHLPESVTPQEASVAGQRSIEHLAGIALACSSKERELRQRRIDDLAKNNLADYEAAALEAMATYDRQKAWGLFVQLTDNFTWQVPTLSWWRATANLAEERATSDTRLKYVPVAALQEWQPDAAHVQVLDASTLKKVSSTYLDLAGAMRHSGVPFLAGTDGPDPYVFPGFSLHEELELMTKAGFTNLEALQTATYNPALFLTKLDRYGVVEPGRVADLVVLDGNPLVDIRNTRKISAVVLDGKFYSRSELDRVMSSVAALVQSTNTTQRANEQAPAAPGAPSK